jgi:hypothetical protein
MRGMRHGLFEMVAVGYDQAAGFKPTSVTFQTLLSTGCTWLRVAPGCSIWMSP